MLKKLLLLIALLAITSFAADYVVIVNPANSTESLPKAMVKRIFTGRSKDLGGSKAVPINLAYSNALSATFLSGVTGMDPDAYKEYWVAQQIKGAGSAPMIQANDAAVISLVSSIPGAIGYITAGSETAAVKVISIK